MKFIDTAKEIYHQVVDKTKEDKKYDEKVVLQETKQNLLDLKENVSYISSVLTELKKAGWIDEQKYNALNAKVLDKNTQQEAAQEISNIVGDIYQRYDTLQSDEKTKVNMVTDALWKSKQSLSGLKNEVMKYTNVDFEKLETELIDEATVKMNEHRYSKWLVGSYKEHIHEKIEELKTGTKHEDANAWQKFTHSVKDMFFGLVGSRFVGKDLKDVLTEKLGKFKDKAVETAEGIKDKGKKLVDEITPEKLKEKEKNLRSYVVVMMKKYGKNIDAATIDRVMKRIDIKKLAADSTPEVQKLFTSNWEDANVVTSLFEAVKLPFHAFFELVGALQEEGVISYSDVAYHVMGDIVSYGLKGFKLFGSGMQVACGHLSLKDVKGEISNIYDKSPDAARVLIRAVMYRTQQSPLFKFALGAGETLTKMALWPLLESKSDIKSLAHITDGLQGNMNTAVKQLEEFAKYLPAGDTPTIKILIDDFKTSVSSFDDMNKIHMLTSELPVGADISLVELEKEYIKRHGGSSKFLSTYKDAKGNFPTNIKYKSFTGEMQSTTKNIGQSVIDNIKGNGFGEKAEFFMSKAKSAVKLKPNELSVLEDAVGYVAHARDGLGDMMNNRGLFKGAKDTFAGLKGGILNMKESLSTGKTYFNFETSQDFEGFMKKMKFVAKQSPETAKFLLGKMPIMMVAGMALGEEGTMDDKMKSLVKDMRSLVPIVGPIMIITGAGKAGDLMKGDPSTWGEVGLGAALVTMDGLKMAKYALRKERGPMMEYILQPLTDVRDIGVFLTKSTKNMVILGKDFANVAKNEGAMKLGESIWKFFRSEGRLGRLGLAAGLVAGGYFTWEYMFASNDIDEETKKKMATYKDNPDQLDKDVQAQRPTLSQSERNDYLRAAVLRQGGFAPEKIGELEVKYDEASKQYTVVLPSIVSHDAVVSLRNTLTDAITTVQPGSAIEMQFLGGGKLAFTKQLQEQFADVPESERKQKIEEYVKAMGYDKPETVLVS